MLRMRLWAVLVCGALTCASCSSILPGSNAGTDIATSAPPPGMEALYFGSAPDRNAAGITYQPGVVFLDAGPAAIRGGSNDGLTWLVDSKAAGAGDIAEGKVLYATSTVAGRVLAVRPQGDNLAVTLGPVQLGDVIKNGRVTFSDAVDVGTMSIQEVPERPGIVSDLAPAPADDPAPDPGGDAPGENAPGGETSGRESPRRATPSSTPPPPPATPTLRRFAGEPGPVAALPPGPALPPPFTEGSKEFTLPLGWAGKIERSSGSVKVQLSNVDRNGLEAVADLGLMFVSPHLDADLGIVDGEVGDSEIRFRGLREVSIDLKAGSVNGQADNLQKTFEVPITFTVPVIVGGLAFNLHFDFKVLLRTAFSAKNSTLSFGGSWTTDGPIGFDKSTGTLTAMVPTFTAKKDIIESVSGTSLGANGLVLAWEAKILLGVGIPWFDAGPYARLTHSTGTTLGSDLGAVKCRQVTVVVTAGGGVGLSYTVKAKTAANVLLEKAGIKARIEDHDTKEVATKEIYNKTTYAPKNDICAPT